MDCVIGKPQAENCMFSLRIAKKVDFFLGYLCESRFRALKVEFHAHHLWQQLRRRPTQSRDRAELSERLEATERFWRLGLTEAVWVWTLMMKEGGLKRRNHTGLCVEGDRFTRRTFSQLILWLHLKLITEKRRERVKK